MKKYFFILSLKGFFMFLPFLLPLFIFSQDKDIYLIDNNTPIKNLEVYDSANYLIGITDSKGKLAIKNHSRICIHSFIYGDTCFYCLNGTIELKPKVNNLKAVTVIGNLDKNELLLKLLNNSKINFITDTVIYYNYNYHREIKEQNWKENFSCILKFEYGKNLKNVKISICEYNYEADTINYKIYDKLLVFQLKSRLLKYINLLSFSKKKFIKRASDIALYTTDSNKVFKLKHENPPMVSLYIFDNQNFIKNINLSLVQDVNHKYFAYL